MRLCGLYLILLLVAPSLCTTVANVLADLTTLQDNLNNANTAITALSPTIGLGTALELLVILSANDALVATLGTGTADVLGSIFLLLISTAFLITHTVQALSPSPVSDADGRVILDGLEALEPSVMDSTAKLLQRKGVIASLPTIPLVGNPLAIAQASLVTLQTALNTLENAAEVAAPASLLDEGNALRYRINADLDSVIAAYAS